MKFTKFAIVLVFILSVCALVLTAFLSTVRQNEKEKRLALQSIKTELEEKVKTLGNEKSELDKQITDMKAQLADKEKELATARDLNTKVRAELDGKDKQLEDGKKSVEELQRAIQISQDRNHELEDTLGNLEKTLNDVKKSEASELPTVPTASASDPKSGFTIQQAAPTKANQVQPKTAAPEAKKESPAPPAANAPRAAESLQAGKVLLVNRKFNFIVINMGVKQGIKVGDGFLVTADKDKVARVEVEKLYDDFAAAKIVEQFGDKSLLKEGNLAARV